MADSEIFDDSDDVDVAGIDNDDADDDVDTGNADVVADKEDGGDNVDGNDGLIHVAFGSTWHLMLLECVIYAVL